MNESFTRTRAKEDRTVNNSSNAVGTMTWSNEMGSRGRKAWMLVIKEENVTTFAGDSIPGMIVVRGTDYRKNGKWSHTTYRLELAPGVRAVSGRDGWETGKFVEGLRSAVSGSGPIDTWADVANALGVSVPSAMKFLRDWRPKAAEALDEVDAKLTALDEAADAAEAKADTETVVVSFGSPTRRQREAGFWQSPKGIPGHAAEIRLIDTSKGWEATNIAIHGMVGTVISATHSSGHGGGYVSVTVAVVPGTATMTEEPAEMIVSEPEPQLEAIAEPVVSEPPPPVEPPKALSAEELAAKLSGFGGGRIKFGSGRK